MTDTTNEFVTRPLVDGPHKDRYSIEYVRGIDSQDDAVTFVKDTASDNATDNKEIAKRDGRVSIRLALATYTAITQGVISEQQRGAAVYTKGEYAALFGRTSSLVSRWISLGYALVRCEIDPKGEYTMPNADGTGESKFDLWKCLVSYGGADATTALLKEGASADEIIAALQKAGYGPDGRKKRGGNSGGAGTPRLRASSSQADGTAVVTDDKGEKETLDVSKNAVRLALELADLWKRFYPQDKIERGDASVIRKALAVVMVEDPADVAAQAATEGEADDEAEAETA